MSSYYITKLFYAISIKIYEIILSHKENISFS